MIKLDKTQKTIVWICAILILGLTYWCAARPFIATKTCHRFALSHTGYTEEDAAAWTFKDSNQINYMFIYEACMHKEGINP